MSYKLEKPFTNIQRADFICQHQGMKYVEDETAIYFLEDGEDFQNNEIVDISETEEYKSKISNQQKEIKKQELIAQINELDSKSIRAIREGGIYDATTEKTWLEFYTEQIQNLRNELNSL